MSSEERKAGYYFTKNMLGEWDIAYWSADHKRWCFPNNPIRFFDGVFSEINNTPITATLLESNERMKELLQKALPMLNHYRMHLGEDEDRADTKAADLITAIEQEIKP